jgi:pimeloyl-ACP methyl ester carboxylesterase
MATELMESRLKQATKPDPGEGSKKVLWNCINRYVKKGSRGESGLTLFFAHANGFFKEIWEPVLQHLLSNASGVQIDEVWTWEAIQHGDSALINKDNLGGIFDWMDNSRDILNFLVNYLPSAPTPSVLPTHLQRLSSTEAESRKSTGYKERTLVAVGHSLGGTTSALVAINYPALFSSLVLVDPIVIQPYMLGSKSEALYDLVMGAIQRREHWPSREEALRLFNLVPFFAAWDPEMLRVFVEHGLTQDPHGGFRLKTSGIQEAIAFADAFVPCEVWELIERLDERIELRWIMPGKPSLVTGGDAMARVRVWRRLKNASNIRIANAGHLIPHEAPREFAEELQSFIQRKYGTRETKL